MTVKVEQECPQCAAPVELRETDRLLRCPYCNVASMLFSTDIFRLVLPNRSNDKDIIHVPYLHFKGSVYTCRGADIQHRIVDTSRRGLPLKGLPLSLGLRPQALKLQFAAPSMAGTWLNHSLSVAEMLAEIDRPDGAHRFTPEYHQAHIGEAVNIIYLPVIARDDQLIDGVLDRSIMPLPPTWETVVAEYGLAPIWQMSFIATLCPGCGWNLTGERDSVVLTCANCHTAWEAGGNSLQPVEFTVVPAAADDTMVLPFWRIEVECGGAGIHSYGDFSRVTNQPRVVQAAWRDMAMHFWCPAFKIRPEIFLNLASRLTIVQPDSIKGRLPHRAIHPITLHRDEAVQSLKLILADAALNKPDIMRLLPEIEFTVKSSALTLLPFVATSHELVHRPIHLSINRQALEFGRRL